MYLCDGTRLARPPSPLTSSQQLRSTVLEGQVHFPMIHRRYRFRWCWLVATGEPHFRRCHGNLWQYMLTGKVHTSLKDIHSWSDSSHLIREYIAQRGHKEPITGHNGVS